MKLMKSALLGSATALVAVASAQAADLPSTKSAPVEYVRVCDVYGAGFFYIPGTQTCLRVGGRVRFELAAQSIKNGYVTRSSGGGAALAGNFRGKNGMDSFGWNSRGYLNMDARTQSAWGTVQTVIIMRVNSNSGVLNNGYANAALNAGNAFSATLENAYIRFAGFTFGRAYSNVLPIPPYMWNTDQAGGFGAGIKQLAYTATFGGGFSATIGIEDAKDSGPAGTYNSLGGNGAAVGAVGANGLGTGAMTVTANGPTRLPNAFANIRVDQAWGWAQLSGVIGQNTANVATPAALAVNGANGPLLKKTGWAVNGAARINLPMLAAGDHLHLAAAYANGLINYAGPEVNGGLGKIGPWNAGLLRNDRNVTAFCANAACTAIGTENTKAWSVLAMFTHYWTPTVRQNLSASYQVVTPGAVTAASDVLVGGLSKARVLSLGTNVIWSPVAGFDIGLELSYARLNQRVTASPAQIAAFNAAAIATGVSLKPSSNVFGARMRVERTF